jgi:hypothetical protein
LHDEHKVTGLRKIARASVFRLKRQHIYKSIPFSPPSSSCPYSLLFRKSFKKVTLLPFIFPFPFTLNFPFYALLPSCSLSGGEEEGEEKEKRKEKWEGMGQGR